MRMPWTIGIRFAKKGHPLWRRPGNMSDERASPVICIYIYSPSQHFLICVTRVVCRWVLFSLGCFCAARAIYLYMTLTFYFFFFSTLHYEHHGHVLQLVTLTCFWIWPCFMHVKSVMFRWFCWFFFFFSSTTPPVCTPLDLIEGFIRRWSFLSQSSGNSHDNPVSFDKQE